MRIHRGTITNLELIPMTPPREDDVRMEVTTPLGVRTHHVGKRNEMLYRLRETFRLPQVDPDFALRDVKEKVVGRQIAFVINTAGVMVTFMNLDHWDGPEIPEHGFGDGRPNPLYNPYFAAPWSAMH